MFLEIIGFQVEIKEKNHQDWDNATVVYLQKGTNYKVVEQKSLFVMY